jgi:hypothetical protein
MRDSEINERFKKGEPRAIPGAVATTLFFLLLSGPPTFRVRDPEASLEGQIDLAVLVQVLVYIAAGIWILVQLRKRETRHELFLSIALTHKLSIVVILCLLISTVESAAPALTLFKVYQLSTLFLFAWIFVRHYGIEATYDRLLIGNLVLCAALAVAVFAASDLVVEMSETGAWRLRGTGVADAASVTVFAIILLMTTRRNISKPFVALLVAFCGVLLFFSLARSAYVITAIFVGFFLTRNSKGSLLRWFLLIGVTGLALAFATGLIPLLNEFRDPSSVWTLSDRLALWGFFIAKTLLGSPWIGLGYFSGTRVLGLDFDPELGAGHSIFFDIFVGGGLIALFFFTWLVLRMCHDVYRLHRHRKNLSVFTALSLFLVVIFNDLIGSSLDMGGTALTFWILVTALPLFGKALATAKSTQVVRALSPPLAGADLGMAENQFGV